MHVTDVLADPEWNRSDAQKIGGYRAALGAPLLRDGKVVGVIFVAKARPEPFSEKQVELVTTFADQAVIAIENVRLFNETQEALERQTATADILKVIASSPNDVQPVFEAIGESANKLVGAHGTTVLRIIGDMVELAAFTPVGKEADAVLRSSFPLPIAGNPHYEKMRRGEIAEAADTEAAHSPLRDIARARGYRSRLLVPLKDDSGVVGAISVTRKEPGAFAAHHVQLLQTFADQAVIAIQNVRLFNETQEALEQQTATTEVLQVINSSPSELAPVFDMILEKAHRLCEVSHGSLQLSDGELFRAVAVHGMAEKFAHRLRQGFVPGPNHPSHRLRQGARFVQIADCAESDDPIARAAFNLTGIRTALFIPLRKEGRLLGQIVAARPTVSLFTEKEIALLENFAGQAVIAMENARLLSELRNRTTDLARSVDELTATGDVLKIISRSSVDLETVLDTLVETVARLCRADQTAMLRRRDNMYHLVAAHGLSAEVEEFQRSRPFAADRSTLSGRVALERRVVQIPDVLQDTEYGYSETQKITGYRTLLGVPLLREESLIGIFIITRTRAAPFTDKEIELATTFADQAVIAIENARLFEELRDRQAELRVTFDNMGDGVAMFGADRHLVAWNRNLQEMLDLPNTFLTGRPSFAELFHYLAARGEFGSAGTRGRIKSQP